MDIIKQHLKENKPYIIADIGSNWRVSHDNTKCYQAALEHIRQAADAGVSAVKFQLFTHKCLYGWDYKQGPTNFDLLSYELNPAWLPDLADMAEQCGVDFMCSAFSTWGVWQVDPFVKVHKLASSELKHWPMHKALAMTDKPVICSIGGNHAIDMIKVRQNIPNSYFMECVVNYPALETDYRYHLIPKYMDLPEVVGVSDHTATGGASTLGMVSGAKVFEMHAQMKEQAPTPDTAVSQDYLSLGRKIRFISETINQAENFLDEVIIHGFNGLGVRPSEKMSVLRYNRRLKVVAPIKKGERFNFGGNFYPVRSLVDDPASESPYRAAEVEGVMARHDYKVGDSVWLKEVTAD